jgi:uncharacterized delta-60 repeat protein
MVGVTQTGLTRFNLNGSPEAGFITNGAAGIPWYSDTVPMRMAEQADGKIVVAGNANYTVVLLRFNTDGSLDTTFNYVGALIVPHGDADIDLETRGLVIQPDGKLAVAASSVVGAARKFTLIRYNPNGSADSTFGNNGRTSATFGSTDQDNAVALLRQPNGRLIVVGTHTVLSTASSIGTSSVQLAGFRADNGSLDSGFGTAGAARITIGDGTQTLGVNDAIEQPDGKLLLAFAASSDISTRLMRLNVDGAPDNAFGVAGTFTSSELPGIDAIALQLDGDLVLGGTSSSNNFAVGRFLSGPSAAVEFYNTALDHYFMSMNPQEVGDLDLGVHPGWVRTGLSFLTYGSAAAAVGTSANPVCRFYIPPQHGDSHFFSADPVECAIARDKTHTDPNFSGYVEETPNAFYIDLPDKATGACPANATPVFRLWNQGTASNHRYTTSVVVKNQMIASGWVAEGYGPNAVDMCAPQ